MILAINLHRALYPTVAVSFEIQTLIFPPISYFLNSCSSHMSLPTNLHITFLHASEQLELENGNFWKTCIFADFCILKFWQMDSLIQCPNKESTPAHFTGHQ